MISLLENSVFFGSLLSLFAYMIGEFLKKKTGKAFMNP